ncbi:MAG: hypothetical protein WAX77_13065 [Methylococcaceae bacterium]
MRSEAYAKADKLALKLNAILSMLKDNEQGLPLLERLHSGFDGIDTNYQQAMYLLNAIQSLLVTQCAEAKHQADSRGMRFLDQLCNQRMLFINTRLNNLKHRDHCAINRRAWRGEIERLETEYNTLNAFVNDFPRYDQSLLIGTQFEHWNPQND